MSEHTVAELTLAMSPAPGKTSILVNIMSIIILLYNIPEIDLVSECDNLDKLVPPFHLPRLYGSDTTFNENRPTNSHGFTLVNNL